MSFIPSTISPVFISAYLIGILCFFPLQINALVVGTYSAPPFSMNEDGEQIGMATEAIQDLLTKSGIKNYTIVNYPLARGLVELENGRIDILYPYISALLPSNNKYTMIGPIAKYRVAIFLRKDYPHEVSFLAMKKWAFGAERGSLGDLFLQQHNLYTEEVTQEANCLKMALANRVTACAMGTLPGMYDAAINSLYDKLRFVGTDLNADIYLALGPSLPPAMVAAIKDTFAKLTADKYFEAKQKDYENKFNIFIKTMS